MAGMVGYDLHAFIVAVNLPVAKRECFTFPFS
jgi:hypothetical protein